MGNIIDRLLLFISKTGETKNSFSTKAGINPSNFNRKMKGELSFTNKDFAKICAYTGVSREWLESGKGEMFVTEDDRAIRSETDAAPASMSDKASKTPDTIRALERENQLLREQLAQKDEYIKRLMDLLANNR